MSECFNQYLGKDGKPSAIYYANLEKLGHETAHNLYLAEMAMFAGVKSSKQIGPTTINALLDIDKKHRKGLAYQSKRKRSKAEQEYADKYISISAVRDDVASHSFQEHEDRITSHLAMKQIALEHYLDVVTKLQAASGNPVGEINLNEEQNKELKETVDKWITDNPQLFLEYKDEVKHKWEAQRDHASMIHKVLEVSLGLWAKYVKSGDITSMSNNQILKEAKAEISKTMPNPRSKYNPTIKGGIMDKLDSGIQYIFSQVTGDISKKYNPSQGWTVLPELYLTSNALKYTKEGRSADQYLHGLSDVVLLNEETGQSVIYEYKTKSESSSSSFDNPLAEQMKGIFRNYGDTAENQTKIQMSMASMMLEEHGYDVIENNLVLIEGKLSNSNVKDKVSDRKKNWYYGTLKQFFDKTPIKDYNTMRGEMLQLFNVEESVEPSQIGDVVDSFSQGQLEFSKYDKSEFIRKAKENVKEKDGTFTWYNNFSKRSISAVSMSEMENKIGEAREEYENTKTKMPADLLSFFKNSRHNAKSLLASGDMASIPGKLLAGGISKETHKLELVKDIRGFEDVGDDVLLATHKQTGEVSVMSLMPRYNGNVSLETDGENKSSTIFGAYISDKGLEKKYGSIKDFPKADIHNFTLLKLALVGARIKEVRGDAIKSIQSLKVITAYTEENKNMQTSTMEHELSNLRKLRILAGDEAPNALKTLFDSGAKSAIPYTYQGDHVEYLLEMIRRNKDPLQGEAIYGSKSVKSKIKKHIKNSSNGNRDYELARLFREYGIRLRNVLRDEYGTDVDAIAKDPRMVQFQKAYLSLIQIDTNRISKYNTKGFFSGKLSTLDSSSDYYGESVDRIISLAQQQSTTAMSEFVTDMNNHVEALYNLYGVSMTERTFTLDATRGFENLYRDVEFKDGEEENWMRFKDINDPSLRKEEKAFIEFCIDSFKKGYEYIHGKDKAKSYKDKIEEGYVPLIQESKGRQLLKARNFGEAISIAGDILSGGKRTSDILTLEAVGDKVESGFSKELDKSPGIQGSSKRRGMLGLSESGEHLHDRLQLMTNPVAIMTTFMLDAVRSEYMSNAAYGANMVISHLKVAHDATEHSTEEIRKLINTLAVVRIHNVYKEEGKLAQYLDTIAKGTSLAMFWGNLRQIITESAVGVSQTFTSSMSNMIMEMMPKTQEEIDAATRGERVGARFSPKSMVEASKRVASPLGKQLIQDLGLHKVDPEYFKSQEFLLTRKKSLLRTDVGFLPQQAIISRSIVMFGMAQLAEQGILQAYTLDKDSNKYIYKEENDPRFYVYDPDLKVNGESIGHKNPPTTDTDKRRYALWKTHRTDLGLEKGIGSNGRMIVPVSSKENSSIRYYAQKMIPTMDASKTTLGEATVMYRMLLRFKRWMIQKGVNYWQTRHVTDLNGRHIYNKDADGNYVAVWEGQPLEGMLNSMIKLVTDMKKMGIKDGFRSMDQIQKENLTKLLMDLLMMILLFELAHVMELSGMRENTLGNELFRATQNSIGDMMPLFAIGQAFSQEPFGTIGVVTSTVRNVVEYTYYSAIKSADEDMDDAEILEKAKAAADRAFKASGFYRLGKGTAEWIDGGEF